MRCSLFNFRYSSTSISEQDGAEPSSNSVSTGNLLRLANMLDCEEYRKKAEKIFTIYDKILTQIPIALPELVGNLTTYRTGIKQVCPIYHYLLIYPGLEFSFATGLTLGPPFQKFPSKRTRRGFWSVVLVSWSRRNYNKGKEEYTSCAWWTNNLCNLLEYR